MVEDQNSPPWRALRWGMSVGLALLAGGCGSEVLVSDDGGGLCAGAAGGGCEARIGERCVGVAAGRTCEPEACSCASLKEAANADELAAALAGASSGSCIELTGSSYGEVSLPSGVQLLARRPTLPRVGPVTMAADSGLCGVETRGIVVGPGATGVAIRKVRVRDASTRGILFDEGASGRVADTTVEDAGEVGLLMGLSSDVVLERSVVARSGYFGIAGTCGSCACVEAPPFTVKMRKVVAMDNDVAGMWFEGVTVLAEDIAVRDSAVGPNFDFGSGLTVRCSTMIARGIASTGNADYGVGIFDADVTLEPGSTPVRVADNLFGVWAIGIGAGISSLTTLRGAMVEDNRGVGVAIGGSTGPGVVELTDVTVRGTESIAIPVLMDGVSASAEEVGDGILWLDGVQTRLTDVELADNERASLLIHGASEGALDGVRFTGGDAGEAPLLQSYAGGAQPAVQGGTPPLEVTSDEIYPVPPTPELE